MEFGGFFYRDRDGELAALRRRHGGPREHLILIDPWDSGYIELLAGNRWLVLLNEYAELDGVSRYRSEFYWDHASEAHAGRKLTVDDFLRSREAVDADAQRVLALGRRLNRRGSQNMLGRFLDVGQFMTPVPLRQVRFRDPPADLPGLVERGGILRPAGRPDPTPQRPAAPVPVLPSGSAASPPSTRCKVASNAVRGAGAAKGGTTDMLARLVEGAKARARELNP